MWRRAASLLPAVLAAVFLLSSAAGVVLGYAGMLLGDEWLWQLGVGLATPLMLGLAIMMLSPGRPRPGATPPRSPGLAEPGAAADSRGRCGSL